MKMATRRMMKSTKYKSAESKKWKRGGGERFVSPAALKVVQHCEREDDDRDWSTPFPRLLGAVYFMYKKIEKGWCARPRFVPFFKDACH